MLTQHDKQFWSQSSQDFLSAEPFNHLVIDDFFEEEVALKCASEFPEYDSDAWTAHWLNAIENKKALNHWDKFPQTTYQVFSFLMSNAWTKCLSALLKIDDIVPDVGLHGGGLHAHTKGGNLNVHLDYSLHPKLSLQRKLNLIVYMAPDWQSSWGGGLELWSHDPETNKPKSLVKTVENKFNRAIIFDTTQNSWHGLPNKLTCPEGSVRKSFATYYLTTPPSDVDTRGKALFVPHGEQSKDEAVLELIKKRSSVDTAQSVWKTKP